MNKNLSILSTAIVKYTVAAFLRLTLIQTLILINNSLTEDIRARAYLTNISLSIDKFTTDVLEQISNLSELEEDEETRDSSDN